MQNAVREYFKQDLLTPLLAAGLFPDFLQWFWPTPIDPLDRARALETTYEETWADVMRQAGRAGAEGIFRENVRRLWDAQADTPALLLNGTLVQGGGRAILSPLALADGKGFSDRAIDRFSNTNVKPRRLSCLESKNHPTATFCPLTNFRKKHRLACATKAVDHDAPAWPTVLDTQELVRNFSQFGGPARKVAGSTACARCKWVIYGIHRRPLGFMPSGAGAH